jgi:phosphohistidine phosphatase
MKTLYLVRHAKSDKSADSPEDFDRPLNSRGYAEAHKMSLLLKKKNTVPDLIISSPAIRAISTALIFCRNLNYDPKFLSLDKLLYETSAKEYLKCIANIEKQHNTVLLFGHNPMISETAMSLSPDVTEEFQTCGIAGIAATNDWSAFAKGENKLVYFDFPKNQS